MTLTQDNDRNDGKDGNDGDDENDTLIPSFNIYRIPSRTLPPLYQPQVCLPEGLLVGFTFSSYHLLCERPARVSKEKSVMSPI